MLANGYAPIPLFPLRLYPGRGPAAVVPETPRSPPLRDRQILRLIADLLRGTGQFSDVVTGSQPEAGAWSSESGRLASLRLVRFTEAVHSQKGAVVTAERAVTFALTVSVRDSDPDLADDECDRLYQVAANAFAGNDLGGAVFGPASGLAAGQYPERAGPETRLPVEGTFTYYPEQAGHNEDPDS